MRNPSWFSRRYPTLADFEALAWSLRTIIRRCDVSAAGVVFVTQPGFTTICLPAGLGHLEEMWQLAHELGHLVLHEGYISQWQHDRQEAAASKWAARALIPESAVRRHKNASLDAFIAALSAHYEDIPYEDCPQRRLAAEIAGIRLKAVEEVA
jgi:hypothetical protein